MSLLSEETESRRRLGFIEAVLRHISPILESRGFFCVEATPFAVRFESNDVVLTVSHDRLSFEIAVTLALKCENERASTLSDLPYAIATTSTLGSDFFQASEPAAIDTSVGAIAGILKDYGEGAIGGDREAYKRMRYHAEVRNQLYTKQIVQEPVRAAAEEAWRHHDYVKVRELYGSIEDDLTQVEVGRLRYARSRKRPV